MGLGLDLLKIVLNVQEARGDINTQNISDYSKDEMKSIRNNWIQMSPFNHYRTQKYNGAFVIGLRLSKFRDYTQQNGNRTCNNKGTIVELFTSDGTRYFIGDKRFEHEKNFYITSDNIEVVCISLSKYIPRFSDAEIEINRYWMSWGLDTKIGKTDVSFDDMYFGQYIEASEISSIDDDARDFLEELSEEWDNREIIKVIGRQTYEKWRTKFEKIKDTIKDIEQEKIAEQEKEQVEVEKNAVVAAGKKGEDIVSYALKWLDDSYKVIEKRSVDSEGNKRIILSNREYIDEPQEYDDIVIGPNGVFLIETKNYSGKIIIDESHNWIREKKGERRGIANPIQQIRRHEKLIKSFIHEKINIVSVICIANDTAIIEGSENSDVVVVKQDRLVEWIESYEAVNKISNQTIEQIENLIYAHMQ